MDFKSLCKKEGKEYLLEEWDDEKNKPNTPEAIRYCSSVPVWWKCEKGHSWQTQLKSRSMSLPLCPKCREKKLAEKRNNQIKNLEKRNLL